MKTCQRCKEEKDLTLFVFRKDSKDGRAGTCKECSNLRSKLLRRGELDEELSSFRLLKSERAALPVDKGLCNKCGVIFDVTCNGRATCSSCCNDYSRSKYGDAEKAKKAQYLNDNKKHITERKAKWYIDNLQHCLAV